MSTIVYSFFFVAAFIVFFAAFIVFLFAAFIVFFFAAFIVFFIATVTALSWLRADGCWQLTGQTSEPNV